MKRRKMSSAKSCGIAALRLDGRVQENNVATIDWESVARELAGALDSCTTQIEQSRRSGLFWNPGMYCTLQS